MNNKQLLTQLMEDQRLKIRVKVENFLFVHLGLRPCSQTTTPVDLLGAEEMGSAIDGMISPKMGRIRQETDPRNRLAAIASIKKEMRQAYDGIVGTSDQYKGHFEWASALRLRTRVVDVRPTVQEIYMYKERRLGGELRKLMKERGKIRKRMYTRADPTMDRIRFAYPEEFDGSWLREIGKILGYPECCVDAYASDREAGINVEERASSQIEEAGGIEAINPLAYYVGFFYPCFPDCEAAVFRGTECLSQLVDLNPQWEEVYSRLVAENAENIRRQPEVISEYKARAQGANRRF